MENEKDLKARILYLEYEIKCLKGDQVIKRLELEEERGKTKLIAEQCLEYVRQINVAANERVPPKLHVVEDRVKALNQLLAKLI